MTNICIYFKNEKFAEDLEQQIRLVLKEENITKGLPDTKTELLFIDDDEQESLKAVLQYRELPIVLFSADKDMSDYADLVVKKPFRLSAFLQSLKNNSLLPKVRRKECLDFKDYSLYPIKKEIFSTVNQKSIKLTEKEIDILRYLYQIAPEIADKEELLEKVWGYSSDATTHTVETHIYRLRQKVEKEGKTQLIITENNGYRLNI